MNQLVTLEKQPEVWIHFSAHADQIVMYDKYQQFGILKPKGLWITPEYADNNWFQWCMSDNFRTSNLNFVHDVKIKPATKLLRLECADDIDQFSDQYSYAPVPEVQQHRQAVRWNQLAKQYDGILIPNYIYERRLAAGAAWYYGWDCASGCIWNASAVESITIRSTVSAGYVSKDFDLEKALKRGKELVDEMEKAENEV